jgi:hypothetical protein
MATWTTPRSQKIALAEMRASSVRGLLACCSDNRCANSITVNADQCPDDLRLFDFEDRFVCKACSPCVADVRSDFHLDKQSAIASMLAFRPR